MARKEVSVHVPVQQGFGFGVVNEQGAEPPFLWREVEVLAAIERIQGCKWASVDSETTGLTDASMPVLLSTKEIKQGSSNTLRMRTIQARIPTVKGRRGPRENLVFDADRMGPALTERVAHAILSRPLFIAHNAGFDLWWARKCEGRKTMPQYVADTMLLTRALKPRLVLERAAMVEGLHDISDLPDQPEPVREAWKSLIAGGSGGSLADVVLSMFGVVLDKTYQKPHNWTGLLGFAHHTYAADDTVWADRILCQLLDISPDGDLYQAYLGVRARSAVVRMLEPQVPDLVLLRENGMPASEQIAHRYVRRKRRDLATKVAELIDIEPNLALHRAKLSDPDAGIDDGLKKSLAEAFTQRGVLLRTTAATAAPQVGEKDLRACRAAQIESSRPLFNAWVAVCRAKKASAMALDVAGFIRRGPDGRLRSLLSHGPVTGRLSAQEPNCQQWPRDQLFRAICISETLPGCEDTQVLVTEHNRAFLCDVLDSVVQVGETVTVMTAWLAAMFYSTKLLDGSEKEKKRLAQLAGDTLALGRDEGWVSVLVDQASYPLLSDLSETAVMVGAPARVSAAALVQALEHTQLFEPCTKAERTELKKLIDAQFKEVIVASDFGALDVRVGAALCIRAQREMLAAAQGEAVPGNTQPQEDVLAVVRDVARLLEGLSATARLEAAQGRYRISTERYAQQIETLKQDLDDEKISRKLFFRQRSDIKEKLLCAKLGWRLAQCLALAAARGEREYSALRDAFIAEIDIHTFTGMKLIGRDPMAEFAGLERVARKALEKKLKKELGPRRQQGKIANLSLLYGMEDAGFQEAAARNYDEHWTMQETHDIRSLWMNAYPEVELWHLWTECLCAGYVYEPSQEKEKQKATRVSWWLVRTLAGRELVARGLNAALSYQDQSSGADILGDINHRLHRDHEAIFLASINQVHDEQVFALPREHADADLEIIERVMVQEANKHTMPYGVPCAVSPACGPIWIKD